MKEVNNSDSVLLKKKNKHVAPNKSKLKPDQFI